MKTVFLCIPHHVFTSDLLRTKYIEYLSQNNRVVVFTPFIGESESIAERYFRSPNVIYKKWELENSKLWSIFKFLRICLVDEFDYLPSVKYFYKRPNFTGNWRRRLVHFLGKPFSRIFTAGFFTWWELRLLASSKKFSQLIEEFKPSLLAAATPGFDPLDCELILLAKKAGIPTVAMNFTWDNLTMNCKHIRKPDYLIAWNGVMKEEAIRIHRYDPEKVFISGTPRFDPYFLKDTNEPTREQFLKSKGLDPAYKTIFHTTVTRAYTFQKKYIRDLLDLRKSGAIPYVNLFFRTHPLDDLKSYQEFFGQKDVCFEKAGAEARTADGRIKVEMTYNDLLNLKYSMMYSDININYASTITIEECVFDKPVINIGYLGVYTFAYDFDHYRPIYQSGAVRLVKEDSQLPELINMYLKDPSVDSAARRDIVNRYVMFTDGLSYKRSVDLLEKIK